VKDITNLVKALVAARFGLDVDEISPQTTLQDELGADSLDVVDLILELEEVFEIKVAANKVATLNTIGCLVALIHDARHGGTVTQRTTPALRDSVARGRERDI
jgi:acyl carrier protein